MAVTKEQPARRDKMPLNRDTNRIGNSFMFPPEVIDDIHVKAELGRYRMRGFSLFKKIPTWDDLTFLPGTLTRFVIEGYREKCLTKTVIGPRAKRPLELDIPIYVTGMRFRRSVLRSQNRFGARCNHGRNGDLLGRGRHDPRRAALFLQVVLSVHSVPLRLQSPSPAVGGWLRIFHRPRL